MIKYFVQPSEMAEIPKDIPCLIDGGIWPDRSQIAVVGPSGAAKSFFALSMGYALATKRDWSSYATHAEGMIIYVSAEGFAGMPARLMALCAEFGDDPKSLDNKLVFCRVPFDASDEEMCESVRAEIAMLGEPVAAFIWDTLTANALPGFDENVAAQMKVQVGSMQLLCEEFGAAGMVIHHTTHEGTRFRGSTVFGAAMDVILHVKDDNGIRTLSVGKSRDFEPFEPMKFKLVAKHGSAILEPLHIAANEDVDGLHPSERSVLLRLAEEGHGEPVRAKDWERVSGYEHSQFYAIRSKLDKRGLVLSVPKKGYALTQSGQDIVDRHLSNSPLVRLSDRTPKREIGVGLEGPIGSPPIRGDQRTKPRTNSTNKHTRLELVPTEPEPFSEGHWAALLQDGAA